MQKELPCYNFSLLTSIAGYVLNYVFMCLSSPPHLLRPKQNQPTKLQLKTSIHRLYELYKTTPPPNSPLISKKVIQLKTCSTFDYLPMKWCLLFIILRVLVEYNSFQNLNISIHKISMSIKGDIHWPPEGPQTNKDAQTPLWELPMAWDGLIPDSCTSPTIILYPCINKNDLNFTGTFVGRVVKQQLNN